MSETLTPEQRREKLPSVLRNISWNLYTEGQLFYDGQCLLVAVPVCNRTTHPNGEWHYELSIVHVRCDEDYFSIRDSCGDDWGWEASDIEWWVEL